MPITSEYTLDVSDFVSKMDEATGKVREVSGQIGSFSRSASANFNQVEGGASKTTKAMHGIGAALGPMQRVANVLATIGRAIAFAGDGFAKLAPLLVLIPNGLNRFVEPLKKTIAGLTLASATAKVFKGELGPVQAALTYFSSRELGASRTKAIAGALAGFAGSTVIAGLRTVAGLLGLIKKEASAPGKTPAGAAAQALANATGKGASLAAGEAVGAGALAGGAAIGAMAAALTAAGYAIVRGTHEVLDLAGSLNDASAQTGQSVQDLLVLRQAFGNVGLDADSVGDVLTKFQKQLSGLEEGSVQVSGALETLGLSGADFLNLSSVDQLRELTKAFAGVHDQVQRTQLATDLFGKAGGRMLRIISDSEALDTAKEQVGSLGDVMARNAAAFDTLGDTIGALKLTFAGFFAGLLESIAPDLQNVISTLQTVDWTKFGREAGNALRPILHLVQLLTAAVSGLVKLFNAQIPDLPGAPNAPTFNGNHLPGDLARSPASAIQRAGGGGSGASPFDSTLTSHVVRQTNYLAQIAENTKPKAKAAGYNPNDDAVSNGVHAVLGAFGIGPVQIPKVEV